MKLRMVAFGSHLVICGRLMEACGSPTLLIDMLEDRWKQVRTALDEALRLPSSERATWISGIRADDPELADELERLLEGERPERFQRPA